MKYLLLSSLLMLGLFCKAQKSGVSRIQFGADDVAGVLWDHSYSMMQEIVTLVKSGSLVAYKDSLLRRKYILQDLNNKDFYSRKIGTKGMSPSFQDDSIFLSGPYPQYEYILFGKNHIHYFLDQERQFYVSNPDLEKVLSEGSRSFISVYKEILGNGSRLYDLQAAGAAVLKKYAQTIQSLAESLKVKPYYNDSLFGFYKPGEELINTSGSENVTEYYTDPDSLIVIDSTIFTPFDADSVKSFFANFVVVPTIPFSYVIQCHSISPLAAPGYIKEVNGRITYFPQRAMYYASIRELKDQLSRNQMRLLEEIIFYAMQESGRER